MAEPTYTADSQSNPSHTLYHEGGRRPRRHRAWPGMIAVLVLIGGAVAISSAVAQPSWGNRHHGEGMDEERLFNRLEFATAFVLDLIGADDAQSAEIEAIVGDAAVTLLDFHAEGEALHEAFRAELLSDSPDPERLEALRVELVSLVDRGSSEALNTFVAVQGVLTPEQMAQIRSHFHGE